VICPVWTFSRPSTLALPVNQTLPSGPGTRSWSCVPFGTEYSAVTRFSRMSNFAIRSFWPSLAQRLPSGPSSTCVGPPVKPLE
jgi:hypothetical protein